MERGQLRIRALNTVISGKGARQMRIVLEEIFLCQMLMRVKISQSLLGAPAQHTKMFIVVDINVADPIDFI